MKYHNRYNKHLSRLSWKGREKMVEKQIDLTMKNLEMDIPLDKQFFKLIDGEYQIGQTYPWLHPDKDYPEP